jgi:DNA polymerase-1
LQGFSRPPFFRVEKVFLSERRLVRTVSPMSSPETSPCLLLVDGHAYAYRAFHAIRSLNAPDGSPTNAIYGFIKMLQKMEGILKPTHRMVIWDGGLAAERMAELPGYKQQRPPTPEGLSSQLPQLVDWLDAAGIPSFEREGEEADDWIGAYAFRADAAGWRAIVASSDKDFMQLVNDRIGLFNPNDKTEKVWGAADVVAKTGVEPRQIVDWLSLIGDSVDNIPGVPGIGPKTATDLLKRFDNIDALLARLNEVKSDKQRAELLGAAENLRRNRRMIALKTGFSDGPELATLAGGTPDKRRLREMYTRWGFRSLLSELGPEETSPAQGNLF